MKKVILYIAILLPTLVFAQKKASQVAFNGLKGNYIYNLFKPASAVHPDGDVVGFRLDRKLASDITWQTLQTFSSPATYQELYNGIEEGKRKAFEYQSENAYNINDVWPIYKKTFGYDSLSSYLTQQHLAIAFKLLLVDSTANPQNSYQYRVVQLKRDGGEYGKYVSEPVSLNRNTLVANKPKAANRKTSGGIFRLTFKAKATPEVPQAIMIMRKGENDKNFNRVILPYSIEQNADSLVYELVDNQVAENQLYQYFIMPCNRFGGGGNVNSDTLAVADIDQKMLIPKAFAVAVDSIKQQINLSWGFIKPELVSMVKIYRSEDYEDGYTYLGATKQAVYADKTAVPGKKYYYYLVMADMLGRSSERSTKAYALMQNAQKPVSPMYVSVVKNQNGNQISWQDYGQQTRGFKIYKTQQLNGDLTPLDTFVYAAKNMEGKYSFIDTSKNTGGTVGYAVIAESFSNVVSNFSKTVYINESTNGPILKAPMFLDFTRDKETVHLFWRMDKEAGQPVGYNIYRKMGNADYKKVNTSLINANKTSYTDIFRLVDANVLYKITAVGLNGKESEQSDELQVNYASAMAYPPTSLKSTFTEDRNGIALNWQPSQSAVSKYQVYRYTRGEEPIKIAEVDATKVSYTDAQFNKTATNYYYIIAVSADGALSAPSKETFTTVAK